MPKLKVRKAAKKRYKQLSPTKFLYKKAFRGHILEKKSPKRKRSLRNSFVVDKREVKAIRRMLIS